MNIDRTLLGQKLQQLTEQQDHLIAEVNAVRGAIQFCRHLIDLSNEEPAAGADAPEATKARRRRSEGTTPIRTS